jgi:hypothetical protein
MKNKIKKIIKKIVGKKNLGRIDFIRSSNSDYDWGGPFNGQKFRQKIFFDICFLFDINAIVETGTYKGTTTELFAATSIPVFSTEIEDRNYSYSRMKFLFKKSGANIYNLDSRIFLKKVFEKLDPKKVTFFYLDAHWKEDLPLREEIEIIFSRWEKPIVMIDDFKVPSKEYEYDDYGSNKTLEVEYIKDIISEFNIGCFYPAVDASEETGMKRGSVLLCGKNLRKKLSKKMDNVLDEK